MNYVGILNISGDQGNTIWFAWWKYLALYSAKRFKNFDNICDL